MAQSTKGNSSKGRAAESFAKIKNTKPPAVTCNACKAALLSVQQMDTTSLKGIELAFKAHCSACDKDTWAIRGESTAIRAFYTALEKSVGSPVQMGSAKPATDD